LNIGGKKTGQPMAADGLLPRDRVSCAHRLRFLNEQLTDVEIDAFATPLNPNAELDVIDDSTVDIELYGVHRAQRPRPSEYLPKRRQHLAP
jgi:hypothetical protein